MARKQRLGPSTSQQHPIHIAPTSISISHRIDIVSTAIFTFGPLHILQVKRCQHWYDEMGWDGMIRYDMMQCKCDVKKVVPNGVTYYRHRTNNISSTSHPITAYWDELTWIVWIHHLLLTSHHIRADTQAHYNSSWHRIFHKHLRHYLTQHTIADRGRV